MVELYGLRTDTECPKIGESGVPVEVRELLATFDSEDMAHLYASESELSTAKKLHFQANVWRNQYRYRKESLLRYYDEYEIQSEASPPIHNPVL